MTRAPNTVLAHGMLALDETDLKLLTVLQENGRLTNQELGERIGLSASQCSRRRSALEAGGIVLGYHAQLSREALGFGLLVIVQVTLNAHSGDNAERFCQLVAELPEVQEAYVMTGDTDYQLKICVRDLEELSALINKVLLPHDSVARLRSSIVLQKLKDNTHLPIRTRLRRQ